MKIEKSKGIGGSCDWGCALDKHTRKSVLIGHNEHGYPTFDTERSEMGEALFQLKYRQKYDQADIIAEFIGRVFAHEKARHLRNAHIIVPMPATTPRTVQPVTLIAKKMEECIGIPVVENLLLKHPNQKGEAALKNIEGLENKIAALDGKFYIQDVLPDGKWDAVIVDDLYDSGASMEMAIRALKKYPKIGKVYAICCTWK